MVKSNKDRDDDLSRSIKEKQEQMIRKLTHEGVEKCARGASTALDVSIFNVPSLQHLILLTDIIVFFAPGDRR